MMLQKRLAAKILKCSPKRASIDPEQHEEIKKAITKADVHRLIAQGLVVKQALHGGSTIRAKKRQLQRSRGRRRGIGSRKGTAGARTSRKETWISHIRAQRALLKRLRDNGGIEPEKFRTLYQRAKGGFFRSVHHLKMYLEEQNLFVKK